jgi:hypothetical protein
MNQAALQQSINQQAQAQAQQQHQAQMMMNQNSMQGQQRAMGQQPAQQGFQHLQHQMQASPLPGQQPPPQMGMGTGMGNNSLPPNMAQNRQQQQFQMAMQAQQQQNGLNRPQNAMPGFSPAEQAIINETANRFFNEASDQERAALTNRLSESTAPQVWQDMEMRGDSPLMFYYRNKAMAGMRQKQVRMQQAQQQQQLALSQQGQNMPNGAPMQQQRSMNPSPLNGQAQPPMGMGGNNGFGDFMGNMDNIAAQQKQAAIAADQGQVVVPANGAQRISTPQPGGMPGQQMGIGMNGQGMPNQMNMAQQQAMRNNQQLQQQQQRLQAQQSQQAAMQARLNAQKMGLQGQPGGMGNGPMPPQQSPALPTLNAPLRTPSQMGQQDSPQVNPNQQFGQQLDPRFAQANNRGLMGPGAGMNGLSQNFMASLSQEQRQKMNGLPPDKLQEVMMRLTQQRAAANMQRQTPQQGNNPMQPSGQMPQASQFNQPGGQFGMPGQRASQMNPSSMTPQQQVALQEQNVQMEQQFARQMDAMDFPSNFRNHPNFPPGVPPEVKKWGALKLWASQNQNSLSPEIMENIRQLMRVHWQGIIRARSQNAANQAGMQPGAQGGQAGMAGMAMSAPVAPMTQNSMHQPPGMNMAGMGQLRQITLQDIQNARQHSGGKMAAATDDQIRGFLMGQQRARQQQQQQMLQQMQMQNQMPNMNDQQARPGQQPPMPNSRPPVPPSTQPAQSKQMPINNPNAVNNLQNANRNARPAPSAAPNMGQNSSPAQPAKNLKRSQSDDVIEVPNPNIAQPLRQPAQQTQQNNAQQTQGQKLVPSQSRPSLNLTPAQVAALSPDERKKHEMLIRVARAEQKIKVIAAEEQHKSENTPFVPVQMGSEEKAKVQTLLKDIIPPTINMSKAMPRYHMMVNDENRVRTFYGIVSGYRLGHGDMLTPSQKNQIAKQFHDPQMSCMKDTLSVSLKDMEHARMTLNTMVNDLSQRHPNMKKSLVNNTQSGPTPPQAPSNTQGQGSTATATPPTVPLNAANLQEQQQQLNKMHQRSGSRSHVPAAPTQTHAPYQFGSAKSPPDGAPVYDRSYALKNDLTQEKLQLPVHKNKKQRPNSSTPGQNTPANASPQVSKTTISPDMKRQVTEPRSQARPILSCSEPECDKHNVGFESEDALRQHTEEEHIKPLSNPLQYAQQNLAASLGLDSQGRSLHQTTKPEAVQAPTAQPMAPGGSKQGQTPAIKSGSTPASTPMNRQVSMNRQASAPGARPVTPAKVTPLKEGSGNVTKQKVPPPPEPVVEDSWANVTIDPNELLQGFQPFESGAGGAISDMNVYRSITPNDTPESSKDSGVSEPNSDISEGVGLDISLDLFGDNNWEPFGPSDANMLFDMDNFGATKEVDSMLFDDSQPAFNFAWDDVADPSTFDKPFSFDTSYYSMNAD